MLDKVNADTFLAVIATIGWAAFAVTAVRTAVRWMAGRADSPEDRTYADALNRDLLKVLADQTKEQTDIIHGMATKQAVLETRLLAVEAELKERR